MNKNGWGLRAELLFILLFIVCILISTVGLYKLGLFGNNDVGIDLTTIKNDNYDYDSLELTVREAGKNYYDNNYPNGSNDTIIVNIDTLVNNGYMSNIYDGNNRKCKGYAKILNTGVSVSYIKCLTYETSGYSSENE